MRTISSSAVSRLMLAAALSGVVGVLTACGGTEGSTSAESPSSSAVQTAEPEPTEETPVPSALDELTGLDQDQMMEVLLTSGELEQVPDGHSTHTGVDYFMDQVAVDLGHYQEAFGEDTCTVVLDSMNVDLVGENPQEGLLHEYRVEDDDGQNQMLYVWMLSYDHAVELEDLSDAIMENCWDTQLSSSNYEVEIEGYEQEPFLGATMTMSNAERAAVVRSAAATLGENLVVISAISLSSDDFDHVVQLQAQKLEDFAQDLADADARR